MKDYSYKGNDNEDKPKRREPFKIRVGRLDQEGLGELIFPKTWNTRTERKNNNDYEYSLDDESNKITKDTLYRVVIREKNYWRGLERQGGDISRFDPKRYLSEFKLNSTQKRDAELALKYRRKIEKLREFSLPDDVNSNRSLTGE
jgi:hypothetical protein